MIYKKSDKTLEKAGTPTTMLLIIEESDMESLVDGQEVALSPLFQFTRLKMSSEAVAWISRNF